MSKVDLSINEEEVLKGFREYFDSFKDDLNNFSYWEPKVENCGIEVPESVIIPVPVEIGQAFFMVRPDEDFEKVYEWVKKDVMPCLKEIPGTGPFVFVKNGTFSNKYCFRDCKVQRNAHELACSIININYDALLVGAGGISELVIREFIEFNHGLTPTIYQGMPLRTEFRVFYDFDKRKVLYSVNYWDYDYCHEAISRDFTDKIIYESHWPHLKQSFEKRKEDVELMISDSMEDVEMTGIWSVDVMWSDEEEEYYLIDMAIAARSAYWDPERI